MQKKNCFTSLICAAVFIFFLVQCNSLSASAAYWPRMVCVVGLALSCLEIVLEGYKWYRTAGEQEKLFPLTWPQTKRALILFVVLLLWSLGLNTLGFLVSSVLAMCVVAVYFDPNKTRRNIIRDILVCVIIGVLVYFMFGYLEVHYPRALLI